VETAQLAAAPGRALCFGDTDHDGKGEVIDYFHIFEAQGGTVYAATPVDLGVYPFATGDLDRDGKSDLVGQGGSRVKVLESADPASYPLQIVWASPPVGSVFGDPTIGDTDLDGKMEIIHSGNGVGNVAYLRIFECTGDNSYAQVCSLKTSTGPQGNKAIADLDLDGLPEIAFSTAKGGVYVVESEGNNAWRMQYVAGTGMLNAYSACVGPDLDGNGKPELFILGNGPNSEGWQTVVFESSGPNTYVAVATFSKYDGWFGGGSHRNAVGNLTGSGHLEYLMNGVEAIWLYSASSPGQWDLITQLPSPDEQHGGIYPVDLNSNGRDELFWVATSPPTIVYEQRGWVAGVQFPSPGSVGQLVVVPNPVRWEAALQFPAGYPSGSRLRVYDAAGRLVQATSLTASSSAARWRCAGLGAGMYFVELEGSQGRPLARGQVTVVR
jgi:hypothetical protein